MRDAADIGLASRRSEWRERAKIFSLATPAGLLMAGLLVMPLLWLAAMSCVENGELSLGNYRRIFTDPFYLGSLWLTVRVALIVTAICAVLGYALAYAMTQMPPWLRVLCLACVALPFWTSVLVRTYAWLVLLQNRGLVNKWLVSSGIVDAPLPLVHNLTGTLIGIVHVMIPFLVFPLYASLRRIDPDYLKAAYGLGSSPTYAFWKVYFPLSLPGLAAGAVLVFVVTLGFYITPAVLGGGRTMMMALVIERDISFHVNWGQASAVALVFVVAILGMFAALARYMSLDRVFQR